MRKTFSTVFVIVSLLLCLGQTAHAVLSNVGPVDPGNGFPVWYLDTAGLGLVPCLSETQSLAIAPVPGNPSATYMCVLLSDATFNANLPVIFPGNFPSEFFYWIADADPNGLGPFVKVARFGLEGTFANLPTVPVNGLQTVFTRVRFRMDPPVTGTYTITYPFGVKVFPNAPAGIKGINFTEDIPLGIPLDFIGALNGNIGPFLHWDTGYPIVMGAEQFAGDPNVLHPVTGSPFGTNFVRIEGPLGANLDGLGNNVVQTNFFFLAGKIFTGVLPTPLTVDRTTYSRSAAGRGHVEVFATSPATALLTVSDPTGTVPTTPMTGDGSGRFFADILVPNASILPPSINVTADNSATNPKNTPTTVSGALIDLVTVSLTQYDATPPGTLTIQASSSDAFAPPVLTALGFGALVPDPINPAAGSLAVSPIVPPPLVTVDSSIGGSDSKQVIVVHANVAPVAVNDTATTTQNVAKVISVLANDFDPDGTLIPSTVTIGTAPANGTAVVNPVTGAVTYTPNLNFVGPNSFTYTVKDDLGATSNIATVSVTVTAVNVPPVAVNDAASTQKNTAVVINVLANDSDPDGTLNPASVTIVAAPANGTAGVNVVTGAVTYTPNLNFFGSNTFTYTVRDNLGALSNVATVTVTVNSPPVAVNDPATTPRNTAVVINVLANDSDPDGTLNPATVAIGLPPVNGATAINTTTGAVTYTPNLNFSGLDSFTYTVKDNLGATSNIATVNVTVTAPNIPPVAVNDTASTARNAAVNILVLANDSDVDGTLNKASVTLVTPPLHGTAVVNTLDGSFNYNPALNFSGADSFTYTVRDNLGAISNVATVSVTVSIETITVARAVYTRSSRTWSIAGTSTIHGPGNAMTFRVGANFTGAVIGTATVDTLGNWSFTQIGSPVLPDATNKISLRSTFGTLLLNVNLQVR